VANQENRFDEMAQGLFAQSSSRRTFLRRAIVLGVSAPTMGALISACAQDVDDDPADDSDLATDPVADDTDDESPDDIEDSEEDPDDDTADEPSGDAVEGGTIVAGAAASPTSLLLHYQPNWPTFQVIRHMYDPLIDLNEDEEPLPWIVTDWEVGEDSRNYTLHLRDDVTFHDGTHLDAEAIKYNLDIQIEDPDIRGHAYLTETAQVESIDVVDDYTLEISLNRGDVFFLLWLTGWDARPVSPTAREEMGDEFDLAPVGSGPFMFGEYEPDSHLDLVRFDDYWDGAPLLDGVRYRIIPEESVHTVEMEAESLDISYAIPIDDVQAMQDAGMIVETRVVPNVTFVSFNLAQEPTSELAVRQAVARAIDRDTIIEQTLFGLGEKSLAGAATASPYYLDGVSDVEYDPEEAGRILDEAGWEMGDNGVRERDGEPLVLKILSTDFARYGLYNEIIQEQIREIGIDSEIELHEWGAYLDLWRADVESFNLTFMSFGSTWFSNWYAVGLRSDEYWHIHQMRNSEDEEIIELYQELDEIIDEVRELPDPDERAERWREGQELVYENQITFWLWHEEGWGVSQPNLRDYRFAHRGFELHKAWLED
jgi:peptide/nickel transport system substrate-binding protein